MKYNKIILLSIFMILLSSFVSASEIAHYNFSDLTDYSGNGNTATNNGASSISDFPTFNLTGSSNPNSFDFESSESDYISSNNDFSNVGGDMTLSYWIKPESFGSANPDMLVSYGESLDLADNGWFSYIGASQNIEFNIYSGSYGTQVVSTGIISSGVWTHVVIVYNNTGTSAEIFLNGVSSGSGSIGKNLPTSSAAANLWISKIRSAGHDYYDGLFDEVKIYNHSLSTNEIQNLYNCNDISSCVGVNESLESTLFREQLSNVTLTGSAWTSIISDVFNISDSSLPAYGSVTGNVLSSAVSEIECRINLNGNIFDSAISRNQDPGVIGNFYSTTINMTFINGSNTIAFECRKVSGSNPTIFSSIGIIHFLRDEFGNDINHLSKRIVGSTSSSSFTLLDSYNFIIGNRTQSSNVAESLVINYNGAYTNNLGSGEELNSYIEVEGFNNCTTMPRYTGNGNTASVSGDCLVKNINSSTNLTINVYALGSSSDFVFNIHNKNFYVGNDEINELVLNSSVNRTDEFSLLFSVPINNTHHDNTSIFAKLSISTSSNNSNVVEGFVNLRDGVVNQNSSILSRGVTVNKGVAIFQWIFEEVPSDNYSIDVYSRCVDGDCELNSVGSFITYITDVTTTSSNAFDLSVFDYFDNSSISDFEVTVGSSGAILTTGTGSVRIFGADPLDNFTIASSFNGGYFERIILNHNTSLDLIVNMNQTIINWNCLEKVSGSNLNCTSPLETLFFNYNVIGNPYTRSINASGYYENIKVFNVSALFNGSLNSIMYSSNLSIGSVSEFGTPAICEYNVTSLNHSFSELVFGAPNSTIGLINGSFNVTANCIGFAVDSQIINISSDVSNVTFNLFTINSIYFNIYNVSTGSLVTNLVNVELKGDTLTVDANTSTGILYVDDLNDDTYKITFTSSGFTPTILFSTISGNNAQSIDVYLKDGDEISFLVKNSLGVYQGDVTLSFIQNINGSDITIGQAVTDFSGRARVYLDPTIDYSFFATKTGYDTFTGVVAPTETEYTITITQEGSQRFVSLFEDINLQYYLTYAAGGSYAYPYLVVNSESGSLNYYGMNATYNNVNYFVNRSSIPAGGIEFFNISVVPSERTLSVNYFFKADGHDLVSWDANYYLMNVSLSNSTLESGIFDDVESLPEFDPAKAFIAIFIILLLFIIFHEASMGNLSASVVGAMLGLGLSYKFQFLPGKLVIISLIVCGTLLVVDNMGGGR